MSPHSPTCSCCANLVAEPASDTILNQYCFAHAFARRYAPRTSLVYCPSCDESEFFTVQYQITVQDLTGTRHTCTFDSSFSFTGRNPEETFYCDREFVYNHINARLGYILAADRTADVYFWRTPDSREPSINAAHLRHESNAAYHATLVTQAQSSLTRTGDYGFCEDCAEEFSVTD